MSSVIESIWKPPTDSSALRRKTAPLPTKNAPPQVSRAGWMPRLNSAASFGMRPSSRNARWKMSGLRKTCGVWTTPTSRLPNQGTVSWRNERDRDVVGVEDRDEIALRLLERRVQVARLGVLARPAQVLRAVPLREIAHLVAVAVVEHVDR